MDGRTEGISRTMVGKALFLTLFLASVSFAGKIVIPQTGPQGPAGADGKDGRNGTDASLPQTQAGLGADVEVWRKGPYSASAQYRHDFVRPQDAIYGVLGVRLGKSPESMRIDALEKKIEALNRILERQSTEERPVKGVIRGSN